MGCDSGNQPVAAAQLPLQSNATLRRYLKHLGKDAGHRDAVSREGYGQSPGLTHKFSV